MERQPPVMLQRRMRSPDGVDLGDDFREAVGALVVAHANLILLRIEILLGPGAKRNVFRKFEPAVDAVRRADGCGKHEPYVEGRPPPALKIGVEDVWSVGEE